MNRLSRTWCRIVVSGLISIQSLPATAAVLTVTNTADSGAGSLRAAIDASASGDTVQFAAGLSGQTIHVQSTLLLFRSLTIDGSTLATPITLSGDSDMDLDGDVRILGGLPGTEVTIDGVTLARGHNPGNFGGAIQSAGTVNLIDSTVSNCTAGVGAGVSASKLRVSGSTFTGNQASNSGGALQSPDAVIVNSTLVGNSALQGGAIRIDSSDFMRIVNTTISGNSAPVGAGIYLNGTMDLENSIIADSTGGGPDCEIVGGSIASNVRSLIEDGSCPSALTGDPALGSLQLNGGRTATMLPASTSPVVDAGSDEICDDETVGGADQRGVARPTGFACDIGATEQGDVILVTNADDTNDGVCDSDCTLREALFAADSDPSPSLILFVEPMTIDIASNLPRIDSPLRIDAEGQALTIDGNGHSLLWVEGTELRIDGLTLVSGAAVNGAAVYVINAKFAAVDSTFEGNAASDSGGAIYADTSEIAVDRSAFLSNSAGLYGGAIMLLDTGADINNCTLGANTSIDAALAVYTSTLTYVGLVHCTFSGNTASTFNSNAQLGLGNNIMANSTGGAECLGNPPFFSIGNIVEDGSCGTYIPLDPGIDPVAAFNGGPTKTFKLLSTSFPAIDVGDSGMCDASGKVDQRGVLRPIGSGCDVGSYEYGTAVCGNGQLEGGEDCDDGNVADGDCCSSTCTVDADGTTCTDGGMECTDYVCASGACIASPAADGTPCADDGVACTDDVCLSTVCTSVPNDSLCDDGSVCTTDSCDADEGCILTAAPLPTCENITPGKASLSIANSLDTAKRSVQFKWSNGSFDFGAFGDPSATTDYTLCLYSDEDLLISLAAAPAGSNCGSKPCWSATGSGPTGVKYKDASASGDGILAVSGKSSMDGKGKIQLKAKGTNMPVFAIGSGLAFPLVAQVRTSNASCWEASFTSEQASTNTSEKLKAKR